MSTPPDKLMHYCKGTWVDGPSLDCPLAAVHKVHLMSTDPAHKVASEKKWWGTR